MEHFAEGYTAAHRGLSFEIPTLALFCAGVRKEVVDRVGLLDERYEVGMFEDDDYSLALKRKGYRVVCAGTFLSSLRPGLLFENGKRRIPEDLSCQQKEVRRKWGIEWEPHLHNEGEKGLAASLKKYAQKSFRKQAYNSLHPCPHPASEAGGDELAQNGANYSAYQKKLTADFTNTGTGICSKMP